MKILLVNQTWFKKELIDLGHEVCTVGFHPHFDIQLTDLLVDFQSFLNRIQHFFVPDAILFLDDSSPLRFIGYSEVPVPLVFYAIDTHHHLTLHASLSSTFDLTIVAQRDYITKIQEVAVQPILLWLPLWNSNPSNIVAWEDRQLLYDALFVGTLNKELNPNRVDLFDRLSHNQHIRAISGDFHELYPQSKVILNQSVKSDLNFRVFEALGTLSCLLTEDIDQGLKDIFKDGEDLILYRKDDADDIQDKVQYLLCRPELRRTLAFNGFHKVNRYHQPINRAKDISAMLLSIQNADYKRNRSNYAEAINLLHLALLQYKDQQAFRSSVLEMSYWMCMKGIESKEKINDSIACLLVRIGLELGNEYYAQLITHLTLHYPDLNFLHLLKLGILSDIDPNSTETKRLTRIFDELMGERQAIASANELIEVIRQM